jgi:anti-sigma B factor antagonist
MDLGLQVTTHGDWTVLSVSGEVDVATAPLLRERVVGLVSDGVDKLVIDLDGVDFLDSTGLGVLVGALKRVRSHDGDLRLACSRPRILKVFEITDLTKVFPIGASVEEAIQAPSS